MASRSIDIDPSIPSPLLSPPPSPPMRPPGLARSALRQTFRDLRAGELRLLLVAVTLAVAALSAVGFFADRLDQGLVRDAQQMLGGDAVVNSDAPVPADFVAQARAERLAVATSASFPSMARAPDDRGGASRLVGVKAVSVGYPLRGRMRVSSGRGQPDALVDHGPPTGSVWVDAAVLDALGLQVGDRLLLGDAQFRIDRMIVVEPDRGVGFAGFSPRVMLAEADLPSTGLVQPASRVGYRLAVAADGSAAAGVARYTGWVLQRIKAASLRGLRIESLQDGRPEMRQTLDRAQKFLNLVALLAALLAAVAVAVAARDFAARRLDDCAMLRVLGVAQRTIAWQYVIEFALIGAVASLLGAAIGYAVHYVFIALLSGLIEATLPAPSVWPAVFGVGVGYTLLFGFGLPPVLQLANVPPLRVIRRDVGGLKTASVAVLGAGALGFALLLLAASFDVQLGLMVVGGFAGASVLFAAVGYAALRLLRRSVPDSGAPRWLILATRQLAARPAFAVLQIAALSLGLLALVLLVLLRTDLISSWRKTLPPDAPNRFVINVQPEQSADFQAQLRRGGVTRYDWYPMIRGRLVQVNGSDAAPHATGDDEAQRLLDREFNLSHTARLPDNNVVVAGAWKADEPDALSVEEGLAKTLNLKLGDRLTFDVGGQTAQGRITSLRKVDWGSMRVNFFVLFPTDRLPDVAVSYIAAYKAPAVSMAVPTSASPAVAASGPSFDNTLVRAFPNITNIDLSSSMAQIQRVLDQVTQAVEFLFVFTLAAGLLVLFATVTSSRETRAHDYAIMRALGASSTLLARVQRAELIGTGALAGVLASLAAMAVGWALAHYAFNFTWTASPLVPLAGGAVGAALAWSAGWWSLRDVLRRPVTEMLRRAV